MPPRYRLHDLILIGLLFRVYKMEIATSCAFADRSRSFEAYLRHKPGIGYNIKYRSASRNVAGKGSFRFNSFALFIVLMTVVREQPQMVAICVFVFPL